MVKNLLLAALIILLPGWVQAQTLVGDRARFGERVVVGGTTFGTSSSVRMIGLATKGSETDCLYISASGDVAKGACGLGVTSVGLSMPSEFNVTGSPVTTTGTLTAAWASVAQYSVFQRGSGSGVPSFSTSLTLGGGLTVTGTTTLNTGLTGFVKAASGVISAGTISDADVPNDITIATTSQLKVTLTTTPQFQVNYDTSNRLEVSTASNGAVTLEAVGTGGAFTFNDALTAPTLTATGDLHVNGGNIDTDDATLYIDDNTAISGSYTFSVGGATTLSSTLDVRSTISDGGDATIDINDSLNVTGGITLSTNAAVNGGNITSTSATLTIDPAGTIALADTTTFGVDAKASNWASGVTGWGITYAGAADFRSMYADELHVKYFIADLERALAGGLIVSKSTAILASDFTCPAPLGTGTLTVYDLPGVANTAVFAASDFVLMRATERGAGLVVSDCLGVVSGYADGANGVQTWTFTSASTGGYVIQQDALALDMGQEADDTNGFAEIIANGIGAPYFQTVTWTTNPTNKTVTTRTGQLTGITSVKEYGIIAGTWAATNGRYLRASDVTGLEIHGSDLKMWNGTTNVIRLNPDGSGSAGSQPYFSMGASGALAAYNSSGAGIWMGADSDDVFKLRVGDLGGSNYLTWNGSTLTVRGALNADDITAGTILADRIGTNTLVAKSLRTRTTCPEAGQDCIKLDSTGIYGYDGTTVQWSATTGDNSRLTAADGNIILDSTGMHVVIDTVGSGEESRAYAFSGLEGTNKLWMGAYASASLQGFKLYNFCESDDTCVVDLISQASTNQVGIYMTTAAAALSTMAFNVPDGVSGYFVFNFDSDQVLKVTESTVEIDSGETLTSSGSVLSVDDTLSVYGTLFVGGPSATQALFFMYDSDAAADNKYFSILNVSGDLTLGTRTDGDSTTYAMLSLNRTGTDGDSITMSDAGSGRFHFSLDDTCSSITMPCIRSDSNYLVLNSYASPIYLNYDVSQSVYTYNALYAYAGPSSGVYGVAITRGLSAGTDGVEVNVRSVSGKKAYVTWTEDSVADRFALGVDNATAELRLRSGTATGTHMATWKMSNGAPVQDMMSGSWGDGVAGSLIGIGRNSYGSGSAGILALYARDNTVYYLWVAKGGSNSGKLCIGTTPPNENTADDGAGNCTVVGSQ